VFEIELFDNRFNIFHKYTQGRGVNAKVVDLGIKLRSTFCNGWQINIAYRRGYALITTSP